MDRVLDVFRAFVHGEDGATMVEYGLMLALIAVVCSGTISCIGAGLNTKFGVVNSSVNGAS